MKNYILAGLISIGSILGYELIDKVLTRFESIETVCYDHTQYIIYNGSISIKLINNHSVECFGDNHGKN